MNSEATLLLKNIKRSFKQGNELVQVLDGLNLKIYPGECVALVGPSGSGKSTLLQIAGLLDTPTAGEVVIGGEDLSRAGDVKRTLARRKRIGFVYQFHHLLPEFSALENVVLPQMMAGVGKVNAEQKAHDLLSGLGLAKRTSHRPAQLSGGEQQRVAIARALANSPQLLLADEPTGNLDHGNSEEVFAMLMAEVKDKKLAALVATHNMDLAKRMDRVVYMENGAVKS